MSTFRTILPQARAPFDISHTDSMLLIGSCFTEHIGKQLEERFFRACINPFGIVYNPVSIARSLERLFTGNAPFEKSELFENQSLWHSWEHHGTFSKPDAAAVLEGINTSYRQAVGVLANARVLLLTLGTAEIQILRSTGQVVANNHKMPASFFDSRYLGPTEIVDALAPQLKKLTEKQPELNIVLSVSPVKHLRNGLIANQRSKAALILACEQLCHMFPQALYFPAYELLQDDLRDYRFYAADMAHPNEQAVAYIWSYFSQMFFSEKTLQLNTRLEKWLAASRHRPLHPDTPEYQAFKAATQAQWERLEREFPFLGRG